MLTFYCTESHRRHTPTRWRDLLFDIKKGANWSFPLHVEGIKSDFYKVHV